jgi:putative hydrolase of the HAD superfamily
LVRHLLGLHAVVFDLDGTLLDRRLSFERFVRDQWLRFSRVLQSVDQATYVQTMIQRDRDGYTPRKELFAGTLARFELPSDLAEALLRDYRAGFPSACVLFPDAAQSLSSLRAAGLKLGLITNGSLRMQSRKLECLALAPAFDTVLISDAEGVRKPDPEIFRRALERLSTQPEHAIFVGDHPEVDVSGARAVGMKAVWRRDRASSQTVEADAIIDELSDLLSLLGLGRHDEAADTGGADRLRE